MNGYWSNCGRGGPAGTFQSTQKMMMTVIQARNRAVPMNRAKPSANCAERVPVPAGAGQHATASDAPGCSAVPARARP